MRRTKEGSVEEKNPNGRRTQQSAPKRTKGDRSVSVNERSTIISLTKEKTEKKKKKISETTRLVEKFKAIPSRIGKQISDSQLCEITLPVGCQIH